MTDAVHEAHPTSEILSLTSVSKRFGPTVALENASFVVRSGTVHALLGENGAGKTTLMRIAFGLLTPDAGIIRVRGHRCRWRSPRDAIAMGIGMVHQHFTLVPAMTVAENIALGGHGRYNVHKTISHVRTISERYGLPIDPQAVVETLPVGAQQRIEILKALARDARFAIVPALRKKIRNVA